MKWTVGKKIGTGFGTALVILVIVGAVSYKSTGTLIEAAQWETHTREVLGKFSELIHALADAETGQRGYIITSQEAYLEPYHSGIAAVETTLKELRSLTRDDPLLEQRLDLLDPQISQRLTRLSEGVELHRTEGFDASQERLLSGEGKEVMDAIRDRIAEMKRAEIAMLKDRSAEAEASAENTKLTIVAGTLSAFAILSVAGFLITQSISNRLREITAAAKKVADGDLTGSELTVRSQDEVGELATAFTTMRANLKEMATQIRLATENVNSTVAEVLASTQQQAGAAKEQAATVQEITGTIEEINQSGVQISDRAKQVAAAAEATSSASTQGLQATQETNQTMESIRTQVEEVAENIVALCERTQTIGEIITTVSEIAEQSNLLALNASIEAASAGTQGGRFSVVAHEMKNLADRAKECTVQVRTLLGEVQKGINSSVMLAEGAVKRVESGKQQATATESTIRELSESTDRSIQAFQQILGGAGQQQIGVAQVAQGMQDIRQAVTQSAASTSQLEKAAANLNALSHQLRTAVTRYRI